MLGTSCHRRKSVRGGKYGATFRYTQQEQTAGKKKSEVEKCGGLASLGSLCYMHSQARARSA